MRAVRWFIGAAIVGLIVVMSLVIWIDRSIPVTIVVNPATAGDIRVQVTGAVATPGMVKVHDDARLADVVEAAGGLADDADISSLNMAGRVGDGERIDIPVIGLTSDVGPPVMDSISSTEQGPDDGPLDLNSATIAELDQLPGIGEVLAGRIVEYRDANAGFQSVDELARVEGISARMVEDLRPLVTVGDGR